MQIPQTSIAPSLETLMSSVVLLVRLCSIFGPSSSWMFHHFANGFAASCASCQKSEGALFVQSFTVPEQIQSEPFSAVQEDLVGESLQSSKEKKEKLQLLVSVSLFVRHPASSSTAKNLQCQTDTPQYATLCAFRDRSHGCANSRGKKSTNRDSK